MSQGTSLTPRSGCGCGGASPTTTRTTSGCGCGLADCNSCQDQGFLRPRFFAGQLLTEDDLELLGGYVTGKNRLHNRHFFGDGVVCGLDVLCHPCDPGKVRIQPGYALDCCGNDIVLPCEEVVDVLGLARQLGGKVSAYGCSEPCPAPPQPTEGKGYARAEASAKKQPAPLEPPQRYCLYLRYCETPTDPTTPYMSSDPCGPDACQTTRVREGYRFELTCRTDMPARSDLVSTITDCLGDLVRTNRVVSEVMFIEGHALYMGPALTEARKETITFTARDQTALAESVSALQAWNASSTGLDKSQVLSGAQRTMDVIGPYLRHRFATVAPTGASPDQLGAAEEAVSSAQVILSSELSSDHGFSGPERAWLQAVTEVAAELPELSPAGTTITPQIRILAQGHAWTRSMQNAYVRALIEVKELLLDNLHPSAPTTDCRLRQDVLEVPLPAVRGTEVLLSEVELVLDATDRLVGSLLRYWLDCLCRALNPPCPDCDDERVLLACLDITDCDITSICTTERRWVITGPSLRYWLPPLNALGDLLEKACCTVRGNLIQQGSLESFLAYLGFSPAVDGDTGAVRVRFSQQQAFTSISKMYAAQGTRQVADLPLATSRIAELAGTRIGVVRSEVFEPKLARTPEVMKDAGLAREEVYSFIDTRVTALVDEKTASVVDAKLASRGTAFAAEATKSFLEREGDRLVAPVVERLAAGSVQPARAAAESLFAEKRPALLASAREAANEAIGAAVAPMVREQFDNVFAARAPVVFAAALDSDAGRDALNEAVSTRVSAGTVEISAGVAEMLKRLDSVEKKANSVAGSLGGHTVTTNRLREMVDKAATVESVALLERDNTALREQLTAMNAELKAIKRRLEA